MPVSYLSGNDRTEYPEHQSNYFFSNYSKPKEVKIGSERRFKSIDSGQDGPSPCCYNVAIPKMNSSFQNISELDKYSA